MQVELHVPIILPEATESFRTSIICSSSEELCSFLTVCTLKKKHKIKIEQTELKLQLYHHVLSTYQPVPVLKTWHIHSFGLKT